MRQLAKSEILCRDAKDLPTQVVDKLHQDFVQKLGKPVSTQFPAFANAFPRTTETMEVNFTPLALIYRQRDSGDYGIRGQYDVKKRIWYSGPNPYFIRQMTLDSIKVTRCFPDGGASCIAILILSVSKATNL